MSTSPQTPRHSPHPSFDLQNASPPERRQSKSSFHEPSTPLRASFNNPEADMTIFSSGGAGGAGGGLGNLADELADMLSDGEDEYYDNEEGTPDISFDLEDGAAHQNKDAPRDSGIEVESPGAGRTPKHMTLSPPIPNRKGHRRTKSDYDGSEYGSESDLDSPGMPPSLVAKIDAVESLARRGMEKTGSLSDETFQRVTEGLRDLGSQSNVEGSATRLITAHSALTTHLSHQTRQLHSLTFPLLSPLVPAPDAETIDELLPMLLSLSDAMPRPSTGAYNSLSALHSITTDLVQTLNYLSDTLHMSRQTTTTATRRLKSAKELVAEMKREEELREEGERWLKRHNWGERLKRRECADVCGEVVGGFEQVCNDWRARLLAQAESAQA
ncbi:hypothetical protein GQ53DRAFT_439747 [Thozetella sp. PMI_491]|nr:hypothetical protein GQ53DRAFT_439747 [Thozetella sp. PMI_491]